MKTYLILIVLLAGGFALAEGVGRTLEQESGLPDKIDPPRSPLTFHLSGNERSISIAWQGKVVDGRQLNRICKKLNEIAVELARPDDHAAVKLAPNSNLFQNQETYEIRSEPERGQPVNANDRRK